MQQFNVCKMECPNGFLEYRKKWVFHLILNRIFEFVMTFLLSNLPPMVNQFFYLGGIANEVRESTSLPNVVRVKLEDTNGEDEVERILTEVSFRKRISPFLVFCGCSKLIFVERKRYKCDKWWRMPSFPLHVMKKQSLPLYYGITFDFCECENLSWWHSLWWREDHRFETRVWRFTAMATTITTTRAATGAQEGGELWWRLGQCEGMVSHCYYMGEWFPKKKWFFPM